MSERRVDYDRIASSYDDRYRANKLEGIAAGLLSLAKVVGPRRILEVGCGTGRWLEELRATGGDVYGLDLSVGMLQQARMGNGQPHLVCGRGDRLPFRESSFDLVFCVHAIHHFDDPRAFVSEAWRLLRSGGALAVVGGDPRRGRDIWFGYDYFDGVYERDLSRVPSWGTVIDWMVAQRFRRVGCREVARTTEAKVGREMLNDPFLKKDSSSQLALLTDEEYTAGVRRIERAVKEAEGAGRTITFRVDISSAMITGHKEET